MMSAKHSKNVISTQRDEKIARATQFFHDSKNIPFVGHERWVPLGFGIPTEPVDMPGLCSQYRAMFRDPRYPGKLPCMLSMEWLPEHWIDVHHIVANSGRSDEFCNFLLVSNRWSKSNHHGLIQDNPAALGEVLRAKWDWDRGHTDWVRLVVLRRIGFPPNTSLERTP